MSELLQATLFWAALNICIKKFIRQCPWILLLLTNAHEYTYFSHTWKQSSDLQPSVTEVIHCSYLVIFFGCIYFWNISAKNILSREFSLHPISHFRPPYQRPVPPEWQSHLRMADHRSVLRVCVSGTSVHEEQTSLPLPEVHDSVQYLTCYFINIHVCRGKYCES